ncbi:hypothetical protein [Verrucomicrobium spinosum]|uniref:hypothetical protein n=1 Tax=Verrucomicrobium spinosum TaxID=2736 RepID=UPI003CCCEF94
MSAGRGHVLALNSAGQVRGWGSDVDGELGNGGLPPTGYPVHCPFGTEAITSISTGTRHSMAVTASGRVWVTGSNANRQLGVENAGKVLTPVLLALPTAVSEVCGDDNASIAVTTSGAIWGWGEAPPRLGILRRR